MSPTRAISITALAAFVVAATVACGGITGTPSAVEPSLAPPPSGTATKARAADLDPCTALTAADLRGFGLPEAPAQREVKDKDRFCGWSAGPKRVAVLVGQGSLAEAEKDIRLGASKPETFGGRDARRIDDPKGCGLLFQVDPSTILAVIAADPAGSCKVADAASNLVLSKLG